MRARDECLSGAPMRSVSWDGVPTLGGLSRYFTLLNDSNRSSNGGYCYRCGGAAPCCAYPADQLQQALFAQAHHPTAHPVYECPECLPQLDEL